MNANQMALKYVLISRRKSFCRGISKKMHRLRFGAEVSICESLLEARNQLTKTSVVLIDEEILLHEGAQEIPEFIDFLVAKEICTILFTDYTKKQATAILDCPDIIRVVSRSLKLAEFSYHLESIEHRITKPSFRSKIKQDNYLEAIIEIQNIHLEKESTDVKMNRILELIGEVSGACRVSLFENRYDYQSRRLMSQRYEWVHEGVEPQIDNSLFNLLPYDPNFNRWDELMSAGDIVCGKISDFPISERPILSTHGVRKLLLLPLVIKGEFWGFVMLSICGDREIWNQDEISFLRSVVQPIGLFFEIKSEERKRDLYYDRLKNIFNSSNIGMVITSREGNLKSFNPAFSKMLGYSEKELLKLNLKVFTHPEDVNKELDLITDLLEGKIPFYLIEKRLIQKGGNTIWIKLNVSPFSKEKGRTKELIGIVENITKEKRAEKALQESEDRYRKLSDLSMEGIVLHNKGVAIDCNEHFLKMSGYSRDELIGKYLVDFLANNDSRELVKEKIRTNDLRSYEATGITKSGDLIDLELENRVIESNGELIRVTVFRDLTERKKREQEIRKLNIAIAQSPSSIVITDRDGNIEYVNRSFCEVTGYTAEDAIGKNPNILKTEIHSTQYYENLWETISSGKTWYGVFRNKTKNGDYYWERAVISPIFDEKQIITNYLAIKENITEEKKAQEALSESESRHRIISELTNDFVYSATINRNTLSLKWTSGSIQKLSGYSQEEIDKLDQGWYSVINQNDFESEVLPAIKRLPEEKVLPLEYRIVSKDGSIRWVLDKIKLTEVNGKNLLVIGAIQDITLRKESTIALNQSKKYLDSIIDNMPIGLHIFDEKGFTARINETQRNLIGVNDINVGLGEFNILTDPLSIAVGSDALYQEVYNKKVTINHEVTINFDTENNQWNTRKGILYLNEIIFPILKEDKSVHSVISLTSDITKRVKAEKALKESEMHQKALLKVMPDLIFVLSEDGIFKNVYTEDNGKLLFPVEEFIGKPFSELFQGEMAEKFYVNLDKAIITKELQSYDYELEVNGVSLFYETRLLVSKENEVIAIIRDITENVKSGRALKESEEKFRELAEKTQDALVLIDVSRKILYASPNLFDILEISPEIYTKYPLRALKLIHPDDQNWVIPELNNYRKGKRATLDLQFRVILESNKQKWIWYRESTVFSDDDVPLRYAAVITDITENKIGEEELKRARDEAEKANRSKSAFLANISHEIRTPMNAVLGFSDLLYSRIQDPVLKGYLNSIKSSGKTLLNLLNDILDLSKIEAKKMSIAPAPVNLFGVFEEIKHIFSLKTLEKGLDYSFDVDKNIPRSLLLDELRLKQILLNLVDNAVKFTDTGRIKVTVKRIDVQLNPDQVDISIIVEDTGIGVPVHLQKEIFESFRQHDEQDKKKFQGTGLGLAITKRLVELFNGEIHLESTPNEGSKFEVILREVEISSSEENDEKPIGQRIRFEHSVLKDKVIVLVDGDKSNRDLIKEVFYHSKSKVIEGEALDNIQKDLNGKVDLIIIELINSEKVLTDLKICNNDKRLVDVPKIGITSSLFDFEQFQSSEFKAIFTKPVNLNQLVETVEAQFQLDIQNPIIKKDTASDALGVDKKVLKKVIRLLEGKYYREWESSLKTPSFSEVEKFAQDIKKIGIENKLTVLQSFSDVLVMHAKNFDIDSMNDVLNSYLNIISELKRSLKSVEQ